VDEERLRNDKYRPTQLLLFSELEFYTKNNFLAAPPLPREKAKERNEIV
jgi:hypothetical protein